MRENNRVSTRINEYLEKQKNSLTNVLLKNTEDLIKMAFKYDHFNNIFIIEPSAVDDMKQFINFEEINEEWKAELSLILNKFYRDKHLDIEKFKSYIKSRKPEIEYEWNYLMCCLVLEGYYGLSRKEIFELMPKNKQVPESVLEKTTQIIMNITQKQNKEEEDLRKKVKEENINWFYKIINRMKKLFALIAIVMMATASYGQFYFGEPLPNLKSKLKLDKIDEYSYATNEFPEGAYAYYIGKDGTVTNMILVPTDSKWLKTIIEWCNDEFVVINDQEWVWYHTLGKINIILMQDEDNNYYFAFILKWE